MKKTICSIVLAVALNPISASAGEFLDSSKQYIKNGKRMPCCKDYWPIK